MRRNAAVGIIEDVKAGAAGGVAGGLAMLAVRAVGIEGGVIRETLPEQFQYSIDQMAGIADETHPTEERALSIASHLLLSGTLGAGYGVVQGVFKARSLWTSLLYASGVYVVMVGIVGPLLRITRAPWSKSGTSNAGEIMIHFLFGSVMMVVTNRMRGANRRTAH
jgi:uncharacterized membrane protein YagU involved in acid resistance